MLSSLRIVAMGLFGSIVFGSVRKNRRLIRENKCVNRGLCSNCQIFTDCSLPQALSAKNVLEKGLPFGTFLNVNIPDLPLKKIEGVRICRQGTELYSEYIDKRIDPRNRTYYWQGCDLQSSIDNSDTDDVFLYRNYISITPIKCDMTDYSVLEELKGWEINKKVE